MLISIEPGRASILREPEVFASLKAKAAATGRALPPQLDCGRLDADGAHLWVDPEWLRAAGPDHPAWREKCAAMLEFARGRGWIDRHGWVRAHIERDASGAAPAGN